MKKKIAFILSMTMMAVSLAGCGTGGAESGSGSPKSAGKSQYTIGISQFAEHGSLDNCRKGFIEGLKEEGIEEGKNLTVKVKNADADTSMATQIASNFVSDNVDLICGIATPSAQAAYNAAMDQNIPVIYTAVTDPVEAQLATDDQKPAGEVTGTSDKLPIEAQLAMIREVLPDAKTIGILYTTSEANSVSSIAEYEKLAGQYGFKIKKSGVTNTSEIQLAAADLLDAADCLTNLTDNTVVSALPTVLGMAEEKHIPVFGSEIEQVRKGCLAAEGIEYVELGKQTGKMAAQVLKGEKKASEMKYETVTDSSLYVNEKAAEDLEITIPDTMKERAVESFTDISQN